MAATLGCKQGTFPFKYLGLPLSHKKLGKTSYLPLIQQVKNSLPGWKGTYLSRGGRMVLLNSVLTSKPIYFMSVFRLPKWVIKEIDRVRRDFFWKGAHDMAKGYALVSWGRVCRPKSQGGLGVRNLETMNIALLAKWTWKALTGGQNLWKIALTLLHINSRFWLHPLSSRILPNMQHAHEFVINFTKFHHGQQSQIRFWLEDWDQGILRYRLPQTFDNMQDQNITLTEVLQGQQMLLISHNQDHYDQLTTLLQAIGPLPYARQTQDTATWLPPVMTYTVKEGYNRLLLGPHVSTARYKTLWKMKIPLKIKIFIWLMAQDRILTTENLQKRGWHLTSFCSLCGLNGETTKHLFNECTFYNGVLMTMDESNEIRITPGWHQILATNDHCVVLDTNYNIQLRSILAVIIFSIWCERCHRVLNNGSNKDHKRVAQHAMQQWISYKNNNRKARTRTDS